MAADLIFAPEAESDISQAYSWYDKQRVGLGEEFLTCLDACVARICRQPLGFSMFHENYRRALVRRFPYAIFFECIDSTITVYGVFHTARDPQKWRDRLV